MSQIVPILSMLHEPAGVNSATRQFHGDTVLAWTLRRLNRDGVVICWEDQAEAAGRLAKVQINGPRRPLPQIETISAARRWADGWRGGLLGTCDFDRGFFGEAVLAACEQQGGDAVLLLDPGAALVDANLVDALIAHAETRPDVDMFFSQAAPGLSGILVRLSLLKNLAAAKGHPGALLCYRPDFGRHDPISDPACAPIAARLARTTRRFTCDSDRQCEVLNAATAHLNGELINISALELLNTLEETAIDEKLPRELVIELTTRRNTSALFRAKADRPDLDLATARRWIAELSPRDDARLVLAGAGDPLLHDGVFEIIDAAHAAGINAIAIETDFVGVPANRVARLTESAVDIISVHLPAAQQATYTAIMGVDAMEEAMGAVRLFAEKRGAQGRGVPLLVPTFTKCRQNIAEMEAWYDHWLRTLACAVITAPSDFSGLIEDSGVADMRPPRRKPCSSLAARLMALSDGAIVSCAEDVRGRQKLGGGLTEAWAKAAEMRRDHQAEQWDKHPVCAGCKQWMRP